MREMIMKTSVMIGMALITSLIVQCAVCAEEITPEQRIEQDLKGDWVVVKDLVDDSKSEIEPSLHRFIFETNAVVRWFYKIDGKPQEHVGRYVIQRAKNTQRMDVMDITVTEPDKGNHLSSTQTIAFVMKDLTVDFDSRFNKDSVGKVLKFNHRDGKRYVFTRKQKSDS
jgi:hypothetical protein